MFAPRVFISLFVVVENVAVLGDADILHGEGREEFWSSALGAYLIYLWECVVAEDDALGCRLQTGRVEHMVVVCKGDRCFAAAVGGESGRSTAFCIDYKDVKTSFAVRLEGNFLAVRAPYRMRIEGCMGCELSCFTAVDRNTVEVAFISEGDGSAIGRDGWVAHPERMFFCAGRECC